MFFLESWPQSQVQLLILVSAHSTKFSPLCGQTYNTGPDAGLSQLT
jgi:hypothetical protein